MIELLLYSSMACPDADALILRIKKHEHMNEEIKLELVETVRNQYQNATGAQTTEGTGKNGSSESAEKVNFHPTSGVNK